MAGGWHKILAVVAAAAVLLLSHAASAQDLTALARLDRARSTLRDAGDGVLLELGISQPVPYRVFLLDAPPRLVMDFSELDFAGLDTAALGTSRHVVALRSGGIRRGWSRLVAELTGPMRVSEAEQRTVGAPLVRVRLEPVSQAEFDSRVGAPEAALWAPLPPAMVGEPHKRQTGEAPLLVALDPGHGGIDPGADADGTNEAALVLGFARELKESLTRAGMRVVLTREEDVFVPLETRMSVARAAGADVMLSLHADALAEGEAAGATIYLLANEASDTASARLAERHDRADLLAGVDLAGQDDEVAQVLMSLARAETQPRADGFAVALLAAIQAAGLKMHKHPVQAADFSVLKAPDIPSALLELGFLSSPTDRASLSDPEWRTKMAAAIGTALQDWAAADAAEALLLRR